MRARLAPAFDSLTIAAPAMDARQHQREAAHLGCIEEELEGIRWVPLHPAQAAGASFWLRHFLPRLLALAREVARTDVVHAGVSHNLYRPFEFPALALGVLLGKRTICVVDMDLRGDARMNLLTGRWSRRSERVCRLVYDPLRKLQLELAARFCSLVLLKGRRLCADFGSGRARVKYFLDAAFGSEHLIPAAQMERKLRVLEDPAAPLELVYFGRLTAYKGVDRCIEAVARARARTATPLHFTILGSGEELEPLRALVVRLGLEEVVEFRPALPFGPGLFELLYSRHLLLAAPLSEDTPRSALDALASGVPILAFATGYYEDLESSGAVELVPWPSVECLAAGIARLARDKSLLAPRARAGLAFARTNTQESWLRARVDWTLQLFPAEAQRA